MGAGPNSAENLLSNPGEPEAPNGSGNLRQAGVSVSKLAVGEVVNKAARFAATVILARELSLHDFGTVNVGIAISGIALTLTSLGLPEYGAREASLPSHDARRIVGTVVFTRLAMLTILSVLALAGTALLSPENLWLVALALLMTIGMSGSGDWLLRGRERMGAVAVAVSVGGAVVLVGSASVVIAVPTAVAALLIFALGETVTCAATWIAARIKRPTIPSLAEIKRVVKISWPLGISGLIIYMSYANLDSIVLAALRSEAEAGLYSGPYRLFLAANTLIIFAAYSLLPMLTRIHHEGKLRTKRHLLVNVSMPLAGYGIMVLGAVELLGEALLPMIFGPAFSGAGAILIILCISMPLYSIGYPAGYSLIGEQKNVSFFVGGAVAGLLNLGVMLILIPLMGAEGAAIASTAGLIGGAVAWLLLSRSVKAILPLLVIATLFSMLGIAAVTTAMTIPIGLATAVAGAVMILSSVKGRRPA